MSTYVVVVLTMDQGPSVKRERQHSLLRARSHELLEHHLVVIAMIVICDGVFQPLVGVLLIRILSVVRNVLIIFFEVVVIFLLLGTTGKRAVKNRNRMLPVDDPDSYERGDYDESGGAEATTPSGEREDMD